MMCDFDYTTVQVDPLFQNTRFSLFLDIRSKQELLIKIAKSQHDTVVVLPRRVRGAGRRRPQNVRSNIAEMQNVAGANLFDWDASALHGRLESHVLGIVGWRTRDQRSADFEI